MVVVVAVVVIVGGANLLTMSAYVIATDSILIDTTDEWRSYRGGRRHGSIRCFVSGGIAIGRPPHVPRLASY
jgi:hypothetical protein